MGSKHMIRVWNEIDLNEIKPRLLIAGSTAADCANCKEVGIPFDSRICPKCGAAFKYMCARVSDAAKEARRLRAKRPDLILIEFKDYKHADARSAARGIWGD